jgi:hypothetical protein
MPRAPAASATHTSTTRSCSVWLSVGLSPVVPVGTRAWVAGAGSNSTREAVARARHAESVGADAVLTVTPYYNKPTQEGSATHTSTTRSCSVWLSVGLSPVVPVGTRAWVP